MSDPDAPPTDVVDVVMPLANIAVVGSHRPRARTLAVLQGITATVRIRIHALPADAWDGDGDGTATWTAAVETDDDRVLRGAVLAVTLHAPDGATLRFVRQGTDATAPLLPVQLTFGATGLDGGQQLLAAGHLFQQWVRRGGASALLTPDQKRAVLVTLLRRALRAGTPPAAFTLDLVAELLDEACARDTLVVDGQRLPLPAPLSDHALAPEDHQRRRRSRLRQWLADIQLPRWREARPILLAHAASTRPAKR